MKDITYNLIKKQMLWHSTDILLQMLCFTWLVSLVTYILVHITTESDSEKKILSPIKLYSHF